MKKLFVMAKKRDCEENNCLSLYQRTGFLHEREELVGCLGAQHGYAALAEIGDALEDGAIGYVTARVEDAAVLAVALVGSLGGADMADAGEHLLLKGIELPVG